MSDNLRELLVEELQDIYDAEQRITKALPKMAKAAQSKELKTAFESHLRQTEQHVSRLEQAFEALGENAKRKECKAMVGLLEEGKDLMEEDNPPDVRDAALIAAAQKVEHYEIATYGCLRTWAELLSEEEVVNLCQATLDEEGETDKKLTSIAQSLNVEALEGEDLDEMGELEEGELEDDGEQVPVRATQKRNPRVS